VALRLFGLLVDFGSRSVRLARPMSTQIGAHRRTVKMSGSIVPGEAVIRAS
jgi:hypothetical protein